jgi:dehydrogenase/reductase SDR family member 1
VACDHRVDRGVEALFDRVRRDEVRLDLLVNNAFASPEQRVLWSDQRFWQFPVAVWDDILAVGLRSHFVATRCAAPMMIEQRSGLVVHVASHAAISGKSAKSRSILPYSVCKAGLHRLSGDMAVELREYGITVVSVWPPGSRTEGVLAQPDVFGDLSNWREPIFTGRVVARLAAAENNLERSGKALVIVDLAREMGLTETGSSPA